MANIVWNYGSDGQNQPVGVLFSALGTTTILGGSPNNFSMKDGSNIVIFHGSFTLNNGVIVSGTITGFDAYYGGPGNHLLEVFGYAIDVGEFKQALAWINANNIEPFYDLVFSKPMIVNGADNDPSFIEYLIGGRSSDRIRGNGGPEAIEGLDGKDFISGGSGFDTLNGGDGIDTVDYSEKSESIVAALAGSTMTNVKAGGAFEDTISNFENINGGKVGDKLFGDGLANRLAGNGGHDALTGKSGNDLLIGGNGFDKISGGNGNDRISGRAGNDVLKGGANNDAFFFDAALAANNIDIIGDFSHLADTMKLDHDIFGALNMGGLKPGFFHVGAVAGDGNDHVIYNPVNGGVFYDADGAGGAAQKRFATLYDSGSHHPTNIAASDFIVVG